MRPLHVRKHAPRRLVFGVDTPETAREIRVGVCGRVGVRFASSSRAATCPGCVEAVRRAERRAFGGLRLVLPPVLVLPEALRNG